MSLIEKDIPITRMDCPTCLPVLEKAVLKLAGVKSARGNYINKILRVVYDPAVIDLDIIEEAIEDVGYRIAYKEYPSVLERIRGLFAGEDDRDSGVETISDEEFGFKVLQANETSVVLFSSQSCPSCKIFKPRYSELARENTEVDFYEMDIGSTETWRKYDVLSIPQVIIFINGEEKKRLTSTINVEDIEKII